MLKLEAKATNCKFAITISSGCQTDKFDDQYFFIVQIIETSAASVGHLLQTKDSLRDLERNPTMVTTMSTIFWNLWTPLKESDVAGDWRMEVSSSNWWIWLWLWLCTTLSLSLSFTSLLRLRVSPPPGQVCQTQPLFTVNHLHWLSGSIRQKLDWYEFIFRNRKEHYIYYVGIANKKNAKLYSRMAKGWVCFFLLFFYQKLDFPFLIQLFDIY